MCLVRDCGGGGGGFVCEAEDGIRYLVRCRGLGDVYKRQLSIQFEERGLYEDVENPLVLFDDDQPCESEGDGAGRAAISEGREPATLELLMERNRLRVEQHLENPLLLLLGSGQLAQPEIRRRFLDVVQVWSTHFQRVLFARSAFTDNVAYGDAFRGHLAEEFGHDQLLADDRGGHPTTVWDPILDATASWFSACLLYTSDAADERSSVDLGGRRTIKNKNSAQTGVTDVYN